MLQAPFLEPLGIHRIGQLPHRRLSQLSVSQATQLVDDPVHGVLLHYDHQAALSDANLRAPVRRLAALRSGWLPVTTAGQSLTRPQPQRGQGRARLPVGEAGKAPVPSRTSARCKSQADDVVQRSRSALLIDQGRRPVMEPPVDPARLLLDRAGHPVALGPGEVIGIDRRAPHDLSPRGAAPVPDHPQRLTRASPFSFTSRANPPGGRRRRHLVSGTLPHGQLMSPEYPLSHECRRVQHDHEEYFYEVRISRYTIKKFS